MDESGVFFSVLYSLGAYLRRFISLINRFILVVTPYLLPTPCLPFFRFAVLIVLPMNLSEESAGRKTFFSKNAFCHFQSHILDIEFQTY